MDQLRPDAEGVNNYGGVALVTGHRSERLDQDAKQFLLFIGQSAALH